MRILLTNLKHFLLTSTLLFCALIATAIGFGVDIDVGDNPLAYTLSGEGPHIFHEGAYLVENHIRGNREQGFYLEQQRHALNAPFSSHAQFKLEGSEFEFQVWPEVQTPKSVYNDGAPIIAISDVESGYKAFRDFLIAHEVIDEGLNWSFGKGHLVLVGDFVDRGFSTTLVLWFIYKLEHEARRQGGHVHFILGNHEIKNLQGNFQKAADKYFHIAAIMGRQQYELYGPDSVLGRWVASKNSLEVINGHLFVHGGIHPDIAQMPYTLDDINAIVRENYRQSYFPKPDRGDEDLLLSTRNGPSWYRGYFQDDLSQEEVELGLKHFGAEAVVVGHHPQWKVKSLYEGRVFAIDVKHPRDYRASIPPKSSEGLIIEDGRYFRALDDGSKELLFTRPEASKGSMQRSSAALLGITAMRSVSSR